MDMLQLITVITPLDWLAVGLLFLGWLVTGYVIDHATGKHPSVTVLMMEYRRDWMRQFVTRQPRIFDGTIIDSLRQGTSFLASACMIAIGGGLALIGNSERLTDIAAGLTMTAADTSAMIVEVKILVVLIFVAVAFLKFIWSNRLFGYCSILMASVPNDPADPVAHHRAQQAAEINIAAARNFNQGLRSVYFALGAIGWLAGAVPLMVTTALTIAVLLRREFGSISRQVMLRRDP